MKKITIIGLFLIFSFSLWGCQTADSKSEPLDQEAPTEISIAFWDSSQHLNGDPVQEYIEEKFNIRFVPINMTYDNYNEILQKKAVQEGLPDIFTHDIAGTSTYETWIRDNKLHPLPKDLSQYPELDKHLSHPYIERFKRADGFFYMIPRMTYDTELLWCMDRCILVRKDWMDKLGLQPPQNWSEFEAMLSAFVYNDPDGNGIDDTEGLTSANSNTLEVLFLSVFPELCNTERGWIYEDEQWMPVYNSKRTGAALQKLQELSRKGLLSENLFYSPTPTAVEDFINGKSGAVCMQYFSLIKAFAERGMLDKADDLIMVIPPWPAEDGNRYRFTTSLHWSELYFGTNIDEQKMDKILELLNWLLSDEFGIIQRYGLEGIDWEYHNGEVKPIDKEMDSPIIKYPSLNIFSYLVEWDLDEQYDDTLTNELLYGKENIQNAQHLLTWYEENTQRIDYNYDIIFMSTPAKNNLISHQVIQEKMHQVILGEEDAVTAWSKVLDNLKETTPLQQAVDEVTAEAARLDILPANN